MVKERNSYDGKSDHDLLIELNVKVDMLHDSHEEHKRKHWTITMALIGAVFTGVSSLVVSGIMFFVRSYS
jgi:hypothetical protein